jgi:hypothetical protein
MHIGTLTKVKQQILIEKLINFANPKMRSYRPEATVDRRLSSNL